MSDLAGFPYFKIEFDKEGRPKSESSFSAAKNFVLELGMTDLCVVSHGWNNDRDEAYELYSQLFTSIRSQVTAGTVDLSARKIGVLGIIWPSKKFGGFAGGDDANAAGFGVQQSDESLHAALDDLKDMLDEASASTQVDTLKSLVPELDSDPATRKSFADGLRALLPQDAASLEDASTLFFFD